MSLLIVIMLLETTVFYIIFFYILIGLKYISVDAVINGLNTAMHFAMGRSLHHCFIRKTKYPCWLSSSLRLCI